MLRDLYGNDGNGELISSSEDEDSGFEDSDEDTPVAVVSKPKATVKKLQPVIEEEEDESDIEEDWKALPTYKEEPVKKPSFKAPPKKASFVVKKPEPA